MNTQIITIDNQKGSVSKATTCANLEIDLAQKGKKMLLINSNPQGSLSISLGNPQLHKLPFTLSNAMGCILMDESICPSERILYHPESVDLLPVASTIYYTPTAKTLQTKYTKLLKTWSANCKPTLSLHTGWSIGDFHTFV